MPRPPRAVADPPSTYRPSPTRRPALWPDLARIGPAGGAGRARRGCAGRTAGPVPRPRPRALPGAARGRWHGRWAAKHRTDPFTLTCLALAALCTLPVVLLDAEWIAALCLLAARPA